MDNVTTTRVEHLIGELERRIGRDREGIRVVFSPLRICPLGAHVDHQGGLVTGMTIDRSLLLAFAPRDDLSVRVESLNFPGRVEFSLDNVPPLVRGDWGNYVRGAALALRQKYDLQVGIDAIVEGDMPIGGVSLSNLPSYPRLRTMDTLRSWSCTLGWSGLLPERTITRAWLNASRLLDCFLHGRVYRFLRTCDCEWSRTRYTRAARSVVAHSMLLALWWS